MSLAEAHPPYILGVCLNDVHEAGLPWITSLGRHRQRSAHRLGWSLQWQSEAAEHHRGPAPAVATGVSDESAAARTGGSVTPRHENPQGCL